MWYSFAFFSALFYSFRGILEKRIIHNVNKYVLGLAIRLFALPFFFLPFLFKPDLAQPLLHLNAPFWFAILMICLVNTPLETYFYYEAIKQEELTLVFPILSLRPAVTLLFGTIFFREIPTIFGIAGLLCIVFGIYALRINTAKEGILEPLRYLRNNKGIQFMFVVMLSQGISDIFDKTGVTNSNAYVYALMNYIGVSITLFVLVFIKARKDLYQLITHAKPFFILGLVIFLYTILNFLALESGFVGYVSAIRSSYIIFTILFGVFFLKEKEGKQKLLAGSFILLGLILLKVFG